MSRGVRSLLFGSTAIAALGVLAGCGHYWFGEREAWRREAEVACINSRVVKETPERVRISAINGPGICGADFPLRVSALGDSAPLGRICVDVPPFATGIVYWTFIHCS